MTVGCVSSHLTCECAICRCMLNDDRPYNIREAEDSKFNSYCAIELGCIEAVWRWLWALGINMYLLSVSSVDACKNATQQHQQQQEERKRDSFCEHLFAVIILREERNDDTQHQQRRWQQCQKENVFVFNASPYEYYYLFIHIICIFCFFSLYIWCEIDRLPAHSIWALSLCACICLRIRVSRSFLRTTHEFRT